MVRRIRRIIRERASAVHPDLQPSSYLLLGWLSQHGPQRGSAVAEQFEHRQGRDQPAGPAPPGPRPGRPLTRPRRRPGDAGRRQRTAVERLALVNDERRQWLDERLGDWSDAELRTFVAQLGSYNRALDGR